MPNGVSCAYFAARNFVYGEKEHNVFKKGLGVVQSTRTADAVTKTVITKNPFINATKSFIGKAASILKKLVYPLIVASGVYNTVKSDDKVKTGVTQATAIASMYGVEKLAEKALNSINKKVLSSQIQHSNKYVRGAWYIAKGAAFIVASMFGYNAGSKIGTNIVDSVRGNKQSNNNKIIDNSTLKINDDTNVFDEMNILNKTS